MNHGDNWIIAASNMKPGEKISFCTAGRQTREELETVIAAQFPDGSIRITHKHGSRVYLCKD